MSTALVRVFEIIFTLSVDDTRSGDYSLFMTLEEYRKTNRLNRSQMGRVLGVSGMTVCRYETGVRIPTREIMNRIIEETGGKVTPNDFYQEALA